MTKQPRTFRFNKLVRDQTVPGYEKDPSVVAMQWRRLSRQELIHALFDKLSDESQEARAALDDEAELAAEVGDVYDVLDAIVATCGLSRDVIEASRMHKNSKRGGFVNGDHIDTIAVTPGSEWEQYCLADSDRYPEVLTDNEAL